VKVLERKPDDDDDDNDDNDNNSNLAVPSFRQRNAAHLLIVIRSEFIFISNGKLKF
jgi:hypothetical protein